MTRSLRLKANLNLSQKNMKQLAFLILNIYSMLSVIAQHHVANGSEVASSDTATELATINLISPKPSEQFNPGSSVDFKFSIMTRDNYRLPPGCQLRLLLLNIGTAELALDYTHNSSYDTIEVTDLHPGKYMATLVIVTHTGAMLPEARRTTCPFEVLSNASEASAVLQQAMKNCKGVECMLLAGIQQQSSQAGGIQVEHRDFSADEVTVTMLPQREWMLKKPTISDYVQCKLDIGQHKELITMPASALVKELIERVEELKEQRKFESFQVVGFQDKEGYVLQENDELLGLADDNRVVYIKAVLNTS